MEKWEIVFKFLKNGEKFPKNRKKKRETSEN